MEKIIFATGNEGKMREIREILKDLDMPILSMKDAGIHVDIVEDGDTSVSYTHLSRMRSSGPSWKICLWMTLWICWKNFRPM